MRNRPTPLPTRLAALAVIGLALAAAPAPAPATTYTFTGQYSTGWFDPDGIDHNDVYGFVNGRDYYNKNWHNGLDPSDPYGHPSSSDIFVDNSDNANFVHGGDSDFDSVVFGLSDMNRNYVIARSLTFQYHSGGSADLLSGGNYRGDGTLQNGYLDTESISLANGFNEKINNVLITGTGANDSLGVKVVAGGSLDLNSIVLCDSLVKTGAGTLTLNPSATFGHGESTIRNLLVQEGVVRTIGANALDGGDLTISGGSLEISDSGLYVKDLVVGGVGGTNTISGSGNLVLAGKVTASGGTNNPYTALTVNAPVRIGSNQLVFEGIAPEIFSGPISSDEEKGGITKDDLFSLTLSGQNTYAGPTIVNFGDLILGASNVLPATTALTVASSGKLYLNPTDMTTYTEAVGSLTGAGKVYLALSTLTVGGLNTDTTFSGTILGAAPTNPHGLTTYYGRLVKVGTGTLTLSGANAYGHTTVSGGRLVVAQPNGDYKTNATLEFALASDLAYATPITGTGAFVKSGAGTLTLSGTNTYSGGTTVKGGSIKLGSAAGIGAGNLTLAGGSLDLNGFSPTINDLRFGDGKTFNDVGAVTNASGKVLGLTGNVLFQGATYSGSNPVQLAAGLDLAAGQHTFGDNGNRSYGGLYDMILSGAITGTGGIDKTGSSWLALTGHSAYGGATNVNAGALYLGAANALPATTALTVGQGAGVYLDPFYDPYVGNAVKQGSYSQTVGSLAGAGSIELGSATLTVGGLNKDTTFSGTISGDGALVKRDTGTLTLSGANSYTHGTTVNGGRLVVAQPIGSYTTNATLEFALASDLAYAAPITGTGAFVKSGAGALTLSGANSYRGATNVTGGGLFLGSTGALPAATDLNVDPLGAVWLTLRGRSGSQSYSQTVGSLAGGGEVHLGSATLTVAAQNRDTTFSGTIFDTGSLVKLGRGTLTLSGANSYTGGTVVKGGQLTVAPGGSVVGPVSVAGGAVFANASGGTLRLSGTSLLDGGVETADGSRTLFAGTASGRGSFTGAGAVEFDGAFSPGDSPAAVSFAGDLALGSASTTLMELGGTTPGRGYDHLTVDGTAFLNGALNVAWYGGFVTSAGQSFDLFDFAHEAGTFASISLPTLDSGLRWDASSLYANGTISIQATPVPEPAPLAVLGLGAIGLLRRRRRA